MATMVAIGKSADPRQGRGRLRRQPAAARPRDRVRSASSRKASARPPTSTRPASSASVIRSDRSSCWTIRRTRCRSACTRFFIRPMASAFCRARCCASWSPPATTAARRGAAGIATTRTASGCDPDARSRAASLAPMKRRGDAAVDEALRASRDVAPDAGRAHRSRSFPRGPARSPGRSLFRRDANLWRTGPAERPAGGLAVAKRASAAATASLSFCRTRRSFSSRRSPPGSSARSSSASIRCTARRNFRSCSPTAQPRRLSATTTNGTSLCPRLAALDPALVLWTSGREFQTRNDARVSAGPRRRAGGAERSRLCSTGDASGAAALQRSRRSDIGLASLYVGHDRRSEGRHADASQSGRECADLP